MTRAHIPVLLKEVVEGLRADTDRQYIDATAGFGGHTFALAKRGAHVLGIDRDPETIQKLRIKKDELRIENVTLVQGSFGDIDVIARKQGFEKIDGILFDLGYSSWQLDESGRGFSYAKNEELDMRFDKIKQEITAQEVVNKIAREELFEIISTYAEEEHAEGIVQGIVDARPIMTTGELIAILDAVIPGQHKERHFARIFQALRIAVNNELGILKIALPKANSLLVSGGRLAIISFHSLEDRIVKQYFKEQEKTLKIITKKPITATRDEILKNSRSRSAKLRIAEKI